MAICRANTGSGGMLFAPLCTTTSNKPSDLQLKHVARFIRTIEQAERLYNKKSAKQLVLQLLV